MKYSIIKKLSLTILATAAAGTVMAGGPLQAPPWHHGTSQSGVPYSIGAPAAPFYSNLVNDTCTSCMYDAANGFLLLGATNCFATGSTQWLAYPFYASKAGAVRSVTIGVTLDSDLCSNGENKFTVGIYSDNCAGPDTALATATATAAAAPCALDTVTFRRGPTLVAGTKYWLVATTAGAPQDPFTGVWWESNYATTYFNFNDGNGWQVSDDGAPGAFSVQ